MLNRKHWRAALASLLTLAFLAGARADLVLCTGEDGHVAIERAVHGICTNPDSAPAAQVDMDAPGHCGHCVDVPLGTAPAIRAGHMRVLHDSPAILVAAPQHTARISESARACPRAYLWPPPSEPAVTFLRI